MLRGKGEKLLSSSLISLFISVVNLLP